MATYNFFNPADGRSFFVRGPETLTKDQAQRIFTEQQAAGALIALKPGQAITPEFQLANGLVTAESAVLTDIKLSAQTRLSGAGVLFPRTSVTNGITIASYAKQPTVDQGMKNMSRTEVTGVLAQVKNLTKQQASEATNLGAGKYAFTVSQLERAGYVKPGTSATYLSAGTRSTLSVLNKTDIWTGKDGVGSLAQLLENPNLQDNIQQYLMNAGLDQLNEVGIKIDLLPGKNQAGLALLSAIDPALAVNYVKNSTANTPIPVDGPTLSTTTSDWQLPERIVRDAAYAAEFAATKVNNDMQNQSQAVGYSNTVDRQVVNSAANQIVGNAKVPKITYGSDPVDANLLQQFTEIFAQFININTQVQNVLAQTTTLSNAVTKESQLIALRKELVALRAAVADLIKQAEVNAPISPQFLLDLDNTLIEISQLAVKIDQALQFIARVLGKKVPGLQGISEDLRSGSVLGLIGATQKASTSYNTFNQ